MAEPPLRGAFQPLIEFDTWRPAEVLTGPVDRQHVAADIDVALSLILHPQLATGIVTGGCEDFVDLGSVAGSNVNHMRWTFIGQPGYESFGHVPYMDKVAFDGSVAPDWLLVCVLCLP